MEGKVNYTLVGLFAVALGTAFVVIVLWLAGHDYRKEYEIYYAYFRESVSGLNVDAPVTYRGVNVGKVVEIQLAPGNPELVQVTLRIERDTPIKQDTVAQLSVQGVTGIAFVDLAGGSRAAPPLTASPGDEVPVIDTAPSLFKRLDLTLTSLVEQFSGLAQDVGAVLDEDNREALSRILANTAMVAETLADHRETLAASLENIAHILENSGQASARLEDTMTRFARAAEAVERLAQQFSTTAEQLTGLIREGREELSGVTRQTLPNLNQLVAELRRMTNNLNRLAQLLEQQPNSLLFGRQAPPPGPGER